MIILWRFLHKVKFFQIVFEFCCFYSLIHIIFIKISIKYTFFKSVSLYKGDWKLTLLCNRQCKGLLPLKLNGLYFYGKTHRKTSISVDKKTIGTINGREKYSQQDHSCTLFPVPSVNSCPSGWKTYLLRALKYWHTEAAKRIQKTYLTS